MALDILKCEPRITILVDTPSLSLVDNPSIAWVQYIFRHRIELRERDGKVETLCEIKFVGGVVVILLRRAQYGDILLHQQDISLYVRLRANYHKQDQRAE